MFGWVFSIFYQYRTKLLVQNHFENTQQLRCYLLGKGTVDGRSDYDAGVVSNIAYLRSKTAYLVENYNKELGARANELARLAGGRVDKNMSLKRYTITGDN